MSIDRLVLGCAQLGMNYGVANSTGKPNLQECNAIVEAAWRGGVRVFDTAQGYGTSESALGLSLEALGVANEAKVVTKTSADPAGLEASVMESLERLRCERLYALLIHDEEKFCKGNFLDYLEAGAKLKRLGLIELFGGSFYDCGRAAKVLDFDVDIVQVPFNLFNDDARRTGVFEEAKKRNKVVMVRSVYLQGRLLLPPFDAMNWGVFAWANSEGPSIAGLSVSGTKFVAFQYAFQNSEDSLVVIGAETRDQVVENILFAEASQIFGLYERADHGLKAPESFYDVRKWSSLWKK